MVIIKLETESQTINRKPHRKVTKLKSKFDFFLAYMNAVPRNTMNTWWKRELTLKCVNLSANLTHE